MPSANACSNLQGNGECDSDRAGLIPQALKHITKHLAVVPRQRYQLSISYCGEQIVGHGSLPHDLSRRRNSNALIQADSYLCHSPCALL